MKTKPIKSIQVKMKNKRFTVTWYNNDSVLLHTRTLQDFKKRIITETLCSYSIESFYTLCSMFNQLDNDVDFSKKYHYIRANRHKNVISAEILDFSKIIENEG
jgi:hypothetical protein